MRVLFTVMLFLSLVACNKKDAPPPVPVAPGSLSASLITAGGFQLNWIFEGKDSVKIFVSRDSLFTQPVAGFNGLSTKETKLLITGLSPDSAYYCQVKTVAGLTSNLLKVTTAACQLASISRDTDPATVPIKFLDVIYDNQNRIIQTTNFSGTQPFVISDVTYGANGIIAAIKETNVLQGSAIFDIKVQGNTLIGTGKRAGNSLFDSLLVELNETGLRRKVRHVRAGLTGLAQTDTIKSITEQIYTYNSTGQLTGVRETGQTDRISPSGAVQTTIDPENQFSYEYLNGDLQKMAVAQKSTPNSAFVAIRTVEFEYDLNLLCPKNYLIDPVPFLAQINFIRSPVLFPEISNSLHLLKKVKTVFHVSTTTNSETLQTYEYTFQGNSRFPRTVKFLETETRRSNGAQVVRDPRIVIYETRCN